MTRLSPEAEEGLAWALKWEKAHPNALGWIGDFDRTAFETGPFGELRRLKMIRADTTDGFGHPLFHIHGEVPSDDRADQLAEREMVQAQTPVVNVQTESQTPEELAAAIREATIARPSGDRSDWAAIASELNLQLAAIHAHATRLALLLAKRDAAAGADRVLRGELAEALEWALPYAEEHAERTSQCCGAAEHGEVEGICAKCRDHTGFDNPDLDYARAALARVKGEA